MTHSRVAARCSPPVRLHLLTTPVVKLYRRSLLLPVAVPVEVPGTEPLCDTRRYSHIPLTLLYSSLTKLFLLFCLSIWRPDGAKSRAPSDSQQPISDANSITPSSAAGLLPNATLFTHPLVLAALELLDEDKLDREWVVRNVLGGMAAGFGLRGTRCHLPFLYRSPWWLTWAETFLPPQYLTGILWLQPDRAELSRCQWYSTATPSSRRSSSSLGGWSRPPWRVS